MTVPYCKTSSGFRPIRVADFTPADIDLLRQRLAARSVLDPTTGCINWTGQHVPKGYGQLKIGGRTGYNVYVHRLAYALVFGEAPSDRGVLHRCDNPKCCNPQHLFTGSAAENSLDMRMKGRQAKGERKPSVKLTADQVYAIRADPRDGHTVARHYGVSFGNVARIRRREIWKHLA